LIFVFTAETQSSQRFYFFSFAVERTAKENHSTTSAQKSHNKDFVSKYDKSSKAVGLEDFSFSASHRKAKK
jgi:hypothetical protein